MEIRVLGEVELWRDGRRLDSLVDKQRGLLAVLLAAPGLTASQDLLIDQLWPDRDAEAAAAALHSCVYRLRKSLDADAVQLRRKGTGYRLEVAAEVVDAHRFERLIDSGRAALGRGDHQDAAQQLRIALDLWRDEAFAGLDLATVRECARSLGELRLDAAEWWLTAELASGRQEEVCRQAEQLIAGHPLRERFWELAMVALVRAGRQSAALQRYRELHRVLDTELGIEPSPPVQELHRQILAGEAELSGPIPDRLTGRRTIAVPRQLPRAKGRFVGREGVLVELTALSRSPTSAAAMITVITGQGGIGKTTLALHWSHAMIEDFPDGQLYVDLLGFAASGQIRTVGEVVRGFLVGLGIPDAEIPSATDDQLALFRTVTRDRQLLLLLDNARNVDQVRPLLPSGPGCGVLITSRDQLAGLVATDGAQLIPLGLFDDDECRDLLAGHIGAERIANDQAGLSKIVETCGRLPLALSIAAARVAGRPQLTLAGAVESLFDPQRGLDALDAGDAAGDVRQVFSWSYSTLEPDEARLFRLLSVHPGPDLSAAAAASLAAIESPTALRLLDRLITANLIMEQLPGRYQLHDLVRQYALELCDSIDGDAERREAELRVLDHYLRTAARSVATDDPARTPMELPPPQPGVIAEDLGRNTLLTWCRIEHDVLRAVIDLGQRIRADWHVCGIIWGIRTHLATFQPPMSGLPFEHAALRSAQRWGEPMAVLDAECYLIYGTATLGDLDQAFDHARHASVLANELDRPRERGVVAAAIGHLHSVRGDEDAAREQDEEAVRCFRVSGYQRGAAKVLNSLGSAEALRGNQVAAITSLEEAVAIYQRLGDDIGLAEILDSLAVAYGMNGEIATATETFQRAIDLFQRTGFHRAPGDSWVRQADLNQKNGESAATRLALRRALAIYTECAPERADRVRSRLIRSATTQTPAARGRAS